MEKKIIRKESTFPEPMCVQGKCHVIKGYHTSQANINKKAIALSEPFASMEIMSTLFHYLECKQS